MATDSVGWAGERSDVPTIYHSPAARWRARCALPTLRLQAQPGARVHSSSPAKAGDPVFQRRWWSKRQAAVNWMHRRRGAW